MNKKKEGRILLELIVWMACSSILFIVLINLYVVQSDTLYVYRTSSEQKMEMLTLDKSIKSDIKNSAVFTRSGSSFSFDGSTYTINTDNITKTKGTHVWVIPGQFSFEVIDIEGKKVLMITKTKEGKKQYELLYRLKFNKSL